MNDRKQWFLNRIWKRIYRDPMNCPCPSCKQVDVEWLIIEDRFHAINLFDTEGDYAVEWILLNYRDEK